TGCEFFSGARWSYPALGRNLALHFAHALTIESIDTRHVSIFEHRPDFQLSVKGNWHVHQRPYAFCHLYHYPLVPVGHATVAAHHRVFDQKKFRDEPVIQFHGQHETSDHCFLPVPSLHTRGYLLLTTWGRSFGIGVGIERRGRELVTRELIEAK